MNGAGMSVTVTDEKVVQQEAPVLINEDGTPTRLGWREIGSNLRKPMANVKQRRGRGGMQFSYITARQVQDRLDAVVGPGNWSTRYRVHDGGAVECTLIIFGVSKADVGYSNNPDADPEDPQYEHEPLKAAYSDAFKRAAVAWGCGRFLYGDAP
jgi:hypothetical protein